MKISILGATSSVGFNLIKLFYDKHPEVKLKIAGRNITKLEYLRKKYANIISAHKFSHGSDLSEIFKDTEACIDLSFQISGVPSQIIKSSILHAENLINESRKNLIKNLIIVGSVGIYGEPKINYKWQEAPLPKEVKPNSLYGRVKLIVEREAWKKAKNIPTNLFLVRSGHIFGAATKMTSSLVQKLINNEPVLLDGRSAFSNATTINGLCNSIITLCFNEKLKGRFCANHVDLCDIPYETLVNSLANILEVEPYKVPFVENNKSRINIFSYIKKYQGQISIFQSKIGLYDFGVSESLYLQFKPSYSTYKINYDIYSSNETSFLNLYNSENIPHTKSLCNESGNLENELDKISNWLKNVGYYNLINY